MKPRLIQSGAAALILLMMAANAVSADQSQGDNDTSSPGLQHSYTVSAEAGATVSLAAQIEVNYQGGKHLAPSQNVAFSVAAQQTSLPVGYSVDDITVAIPATWTGGSASGTGNVSFTAPAEAGQHTYTFKYDPTTFTCISSPCLSGQPGFVVQLSVSEPELEPEPELDPVAPTVTFSSPLDGAVFTIGDMIAADYDCTSDSAMVECAGPVADGASIDTATVGWKTFSVHALDADGDETTDQVSYRVVFPFAFVSPINEDPGVNAAIVAGKRVAIQFTMFGYHGNDVLHGWPRHQQVDCGTGAPIGKATVRQVRTRKYDASTSSYRFIWVTKSSWEDTCRKFYVRLEDKMHHSATFTFIAQF